jgi:hypothetical protein
MFWSTKGKSRAIAEEQREWDGQMSAEGLDLARKIIRERLGRPNLAAFEEQLENGRNAFRAFANSARTSMSEEWFQECLEDELLEFIPDAAFKIVPLLTPNSFQQRECRETVADALALEFGTLAKELFLERQVREIDGASSGASVERHPAPEKQPFGVSPEGAERLCAAWMAHLGTPDVALTPTTGDGGIDLIALPYVAQVKHYSGTVGVESIRELVGVTSVDNLTALFFTSGTYARGAIEFADKAKVALFIYSAEEGTLRDANKLAQDILVSGL